jgi:hypothetical protein
MMCQKLLKRKTRKEKYSYLRNLIQGEIRLAKKPIDIILSLKHVLVFTKAGKPVWARHGDEEVTSALMGILYTMFSIVEETDDELHEIELGGGRKMVYYHVEPLILGTVVKFFIL